MTLNCEVSQSEFSVLSAKLIIKLSKICFLCTYVDQMITQQRFNVLAQPKFKIFSIFYPLFSKDSNDILKIYELPIIYDKIPKYYPKGLWMFDNELNAQQKGTLDNLFD